MLVDNEKRRINTLKKEQDMMMKSKVNNHIPEHPEEPITLDKGYGRALA